MSASVLYDTPGPKAKRRVLLFSVLAGIGLLAVVYLVYSKLDQQNQFDPEKWSPLFDPSDERFPLVWERLGEGLVNTVIAAALAIVFSLVLGTAITVLRLLVPGWSRWVFTGGVELFRGIPVVIAIFFVARVFPEFGIDIDVMWYLVIGLTIYNSVVIAEIVRAGINSLPKGQREAAESLGLTRWQTMSSVLLPQAFRAMLPALISQLVVVLKDTSLGFIISYEETVRVGGQLVQNLSNPIQTYLLIAVIFILVNYALSRLAIYVEKRLSRGKKTVKEEGEAAVVHADDLAGAGATNVG